MASLTLLFLSHIPLLTLLLTFSSGSPVQSPDVLTPEEIRAIEPFTEDVMACANIPGLSLGIIRGGATYEIGLGNANTDDGHAASESTIFNLGSTAKAFVPYVLAELMNGADNSLAK
ncbi:gigasin-6 [Biomphalaria pfeifferi]|uniref:Gigasin-6 n=1 Tax=Biomphalaria pfeifferi TaxID=112525 RepID=A0AAD8BWJ6_BIOPF|nr:gigasin-6 [Biomphalaria pfeifferi]